MGGGWGVGKWGLCCQTRHDSSPPPRNSCVQIIVILYKHSTCVLCAQQHHIYAIYMLNYIICIPAPCMLAARTTKTPTEAAASTHGHDDDAISNSRFRYDVAWLALLYVYNTHTPHFVYMYILYILQLYIYIRDIICRQTRVLFMLARNIFKALLASFCEVKAIYFYLRLFFVCKIYSCVHENRSK